MRCSARVVRLGSLVVSLVLAGCGGSSQKAGGHGATVAIAATGLGAAGFNYTQGTYVVGFVFRATRAIRITSFGYYDANLTGKPEAFGTHAVGVYDLSTHGLLGSATVSTTDPTTGIFRWLELASAIPIGTSDTYAIVGVTGSSSYTVGITAAEAPVAADLVYVSGAGYSSTGTSNAPTETSTLIEPNAFDAGNIFGTPTPSGTMCDFGPDFAYVLAD